MTKKKIAARSRRVDQKAVLAIVTVALAAIGATGFFLQDRPTHTAHSADNHYDVIVVGAGPGGIAAALQAARMGEHVALLEETDWIGGQMTAAGVGTMDEGNVAARKSGIYKEFVDRVTTFYKDRGKSTSTCYYDTSSLCVDPQVGQTILKQMLASQSDNLYVATGVHVSAVLKQGNTVTGVTANGEHYSSRVLVDADEYGDVLAMSGAAYRLSNGTSTSPAPSNACVQSVTVAPVIKYYPDGVPDELTFKKAPPGYNDDLAKHFATFIKKEGGDYFEQHGNSKGLSFKSFAAYRGVPDLSNSKDYNVLQRDGNDITRTSLNSANDYPQNGELSSKFISDLTYRAKTTCQAKLLTLQLLYYIQHDLGETNWSIANDEGYDTPYNEQQNCPELKGFEAFEVQMPQEPYVREGRRLIGTQTLTGDQLQNAYKEGSSIPTFSDSIAVGYYPMDLHGCRSSSIEAAFDSSQNLPKTAASKSGIFQVPIGVMIPQTVDGLLAAEKNISVSRFAEGATREQPISMQIGQAAGALAGLAAKQHTQPRNVSAFEVQQVLRAAGAQIDTGSKL